MDDNAKNVIRLAAVAVGAYIAYQWLESSGMWAQWFGASSNVFTDPNALLAYCQKNSAGQATYSVSGKQTTATCAQWLAANQAASSSSGTAAPSSGSPSPTPAPPAPAIDQTLVAQLRAAAMANPILGTDKATVDQWNYLLNELNPVAIVTDLSSIGIVRGENDSMDAEAYVTLRSRAGLSGIWFENLEQPQWLN